MKRLFSYNFMGKEIEFIKKLLLMINIMVHALETINQLKNCFSAQDVRFGSIATVSLIDYGRAELSTNDTLHVPHSFFK